MGELRQADTPKQGDCLRQKGATTLMRQLSHPSDKESALGGYTAGELTILRGLRDDYGAAEESASGWRLTYKPQWLDKARLQEDISTDLKILEETDSTSFISRDFPPPFFCFTEHQTSGRGRRGKQWLSLPGDALLMSAVLPLPPSVAGLSVAVGAMLWKVLGGETRQLQLKWPNDLLDSAGNKVGGVLIEIANGKLIIGVGLNRNMTPRLAQRISALDGYPAAGLNAALSPSLSRHTCAVQTAQALIDTVFHFATDGFAAFRTLAEEAHVYRLGAEMPGGGRFAGFDEDGALLTDNGGITRRQVG